MLFQPFNGHSGCLVYPPVHLSKWASPHRLQQLDVSQSQMEWIGQWRTQLQNTRLLLGDAAETTQWRWKGRVTAITWLN